MNVEKLLRKYIQDKTMHYNKFKYLYLKDSNKMSCETDFEKGYTAGICHALKEVNRDLTKDNQDVENVINNKIGTGLKWCRKK